MTTNELLIENAKRKGILAACQERLQFASNVASYWINMDGKIKEECFIEIRQHVADAETLWRASQASEKDD